MNTNVLRAVFTRNFVSYFASPTGYVFIWVFMLLSSVAAFWQFEFFNSNLANLDQLNKVFPFIMLVFIPAITMSIWAEERRQGTDELLLTVPAGDFDIVLGKYLAAVAIYTASLLFSLVCNYMMLWWLSKGYLDGGLFLGTYLGYWLVGLAMLAVGMVASFLTSNLTVGFILGALFNVPLVFAQKADIISGPDLARVVKQWSIGEQLLDFGRGMISLSGLIYFVMILVAMLYLSMILIGRRHWIRGGSWYLLGCHYLVRTLALAVLAFTAIAFFHRFDLRWDVTTEKLSSLSPETRKLLRDLDLKRPVQVEAFISQTVPELYVQAQLDLLTMLRELRAQGGNEVRVRVHNTERFSEEAARAEKRFNITPRRVVTTRRGTLTEDHIFMGVAFSCGLEKVVLPFIDRGIPVEYELVRSLCTVTEQQRKKIGILRTDAQLYGRFNFQMMSSSANWPIIDELEKMYEVVEVDPSSLITQEYDALLVVQPSSLGPQEMDNFVAAVRAGVPTAIFEDPFPGFASHVPGTSAPRRPPTGMNPMMRQPPMEKGNIDELWDLLGVRFDAGQIIWQDYNPYPKLGHLPPEWIFVDATLEGTETFNELEPISSNLQSVLLPYPGSISRLNAPVIDGAKLNFEPLVRTGQNAGTVQYSEMLEFSPFGGPRGLNPHRRRYMGNMSYVLAAHIKGIVPTEDAAADDDVSEQEGTSGEEAGTSGEGGESGEGGLAGKDASDADASGQTQEADAADPSDEQVAEKELKEDEKAVGEEPSEDEMPAEQEPKKEDPPEEEEKPTETGINVVLVADIDMLHREFFLLREQGDNPDMGVDFNFDNVTLVLNVLDVLAGDERFVDIRKRRPKHCTLRRVDERIEQARKETTATRERRQKEFEQARDEEQNALDKDMDRLREEMKGKKIDAQEIAHRLAMRLNVRQQRMQTKVDQLQQKQEREIKQIERKEALEIRKVQNMYKFWAVVLPPIPPLIVGLVVFVGRRAREREGVARSRLRS